MLQTQSRGARLSLVIWLNVLQFLADGPVSVRTLISRALTAEAQATAGLGCLERWGVVALQPGRRAGFGRGRGIRGDWPVRITASGETAAGIWAGLIPEIDLRWSKRFGDDGTRLRRSLEAIEHQIDLEFAILKLPEFGPRKSAAEDGLPLPVLLFAAHRSGVGRTLSSAKPITAASSPPTSSESIPTPSDGYAPRAGSRNTAPSRTSRPECSERLHRPRRPELPRPEFPCSPHPPRSS